MFHETSNQVSRVCACMPLPHGGGLVSGREKSHLEGFMNRLRLADYLHPEALTAETLAQAADDVLFRAVQGNEHHVLCSLCHLQREPLCNRIRTCISTLVPLGATNTED